MPLYIECKRTICQNVQAIREQNWKKVPQFEKIAIIYVCTESISAILPSAFSTFIKQSNRTVEETRTNGIVNSNWSANNERTKKRAEEREVVKKKCRKRNEDIRQYGDTCKKAQSLIVITEKYPQRIYSH